MATTDTTDILAILQAVLDAAALSREEAYAAMAEMMDYIQNLPPSEGISPETDPPSEAAASLNALSLTFPGSPLVRDTQMASVPFTQPIPDFTEPIIDDSDPPPFNVPDPGFQIPPPPNVDWPIYTETPPSLDTVEIPGAPSIELPVIPDISDISVPSPPNYNIPDFEGELPVDDLTPPTPTFSWSEELYNSALKQRLSSHLYDQLVAGGTGLNEETEQAIYDRAVSRLREKEEELVIEATDYFAARGFTLPPGVLSGRLLEINNVILQSREDLNNDILVQQSNLAQKNTHFTIDQSRQWENTLIAFHNQVQQRTFDAAKFTLEAALLVYANRVEAYKARLQAYRAQADIYVARIQGEAAKAEFYKAQIAGVQASVEVKKALVDAYTAQVNGLQALMQLYRTEMEGARIHSEIERNKIENFRALVQAYVARVEAATSRYEGYKAQIEGEKAKADYYQSRVQGYTSMVQAYKARADIDIARATALVEFNKAQVAIYEAAVRKYATDVEYAYRSADTIIKVDGLRVNVFSTEGQIYGSELDAAAREFAARIQQLIAEIEAAVRRYDIATRAQETNLEQVQETARTMARTAAQVNAAAISTVTSSTHHGYNWTTASSKVESEVKSSVTQDITQNHWLWQYIHTFEEGT